MSFHFPFLYNSYFPTNFNNYPGSSIPYSRRGFINKPSAPSVEGIGVNASNFKDRTFPHQNKKNNETSSKFQNQNKKNFHQPQTTNNINNSNIDIENNKMSNDSSESNNCFFEIFGLQLQFDDILLIVLIFFLYSEDVKDEELFIILILLLLS